MTRDEIEAIADSAADKAVSKFMVTIGINTQDPLRAQAIFKHLERQYDACQLVQKTSIKTAVGVVATAIMAYVFLAFGIKH